MQLKFKSQNNLVLVIGEKTFLIDFFFKRVCAYEDYFRHLFQLYTAYVESQEQLQLERLENKRVNKYLDDIVQEVETKAPILKRQRDEHERMQKSVASLSAKLEQAVKVHNSTVTQPLLI